MDYFGDPEQKKVDVEQNKPPPPPPPEGMQVKFEYFEISVILTFFLWHLEPKFWWVRVCFRGREIE